MLVQMPTLNLNYEITGGPRSEVEIKAVYAVEGDRTTRLTNECTT